MNDVRCRLSRSHIAELFEFADEMADRIRSVILKFRAEFGTTTYKEAESQRANPVTVIDVAVEKESREMIRAKYPDHNIVGEELGSYQRGGDVTWLLDPIDGTDDMIRNSPLFGTIVCVLYRGSPIVAILDHAKLNIRCKAAFSFGAYFNNNRINLENVDARDIDDAIVLPAYADYCQLPGFKQLYDALCIEYPNHRVFRNVFGHTMVTSGNFAACLEVNQHVWDIFASQLITEEAMGKFVRIHASGDEFKSMRISAVFGRAPTVSRILTLIKRSGMVM